MADNKEQFYSLEDGRSCLPARTIIDLSDGGGRYRITGEPIGYGGSGIIYPAVTMVRDDSGWRDASLRVAVKECFPAGVSQGYYRTETGEIRAAGGRMEEAGALYSFAGKMLQNESLITGRIFTKGFRLTPILHSVSEEIIILPEKPAAKVHNVIGILERLDEKGLPLSGIISQGLNGWQCFRLFGLVLRALGEVHDAGFLHGDIQDHNIFIKGWDDEKSCEISLIDFGSARPLLDDGATEVIRDRMLFTTKGYAAPECLQKNDGTLRLTRSADLYAAGVLLLAMLNGRPPEQRAIALTIDGRYFLQRRARKLGIPSGAAAKINELLTGLLQQDPAMRYQSVKEVLEISERIEQALTPRTTALEAIDYDAFISYCHEAPADYIANLLQKKLERYKIPKTVSGQSRKLAMGRVFLDRYELAAGGDMDDDLRSVLAHSEFLIVILSPGVTESRWVAREIEIFLESHSKNNILPVLADGQLQDVIPASLSEGGKAISETAKSPSLRSLAADVRGKNNRERKRKLHTEICRLLAPMLGCGFDDLVMRQKVYQQQRMLRIVSAAFILSVLILGIIGSQALIIRKNYRDALKRESISLAEQAEDALEKGDRAGAVSLALSALPDPGKGSDMPETPQAKAALIHSMGYYQGEEHGIRAFMPRYLLKMDYGAPDNGAVYPDISEAVNDEGTCLASADKKDTVYAWSMSDGSLLQRWDRSAIREACTDKRDGLGKVLCLAFDSEDTLLIITDCAILEGNTITGRLKLRGTFPQLYTVNKVICLNRLHGIIVCRNEKDRDSGKYGMVFELLDVRNGAVSCTMNVSDVIPADDAGNMNTLDYIQPAADGKAAAIALSNGMTYGKRSRLLIWYPERDQCILSDLGETGIYGLNCVSEDMITALISDSPWMSLSSGEVRESRLSLILTGNGKCIRTADISTSLTDIHSGAHAFSLNDETYILFWAGTQLYLFTADGKEIFSGSAHGVLCGAAPLSDDQFLFCTEDGQILQFALACGIVSDTPVKIDMHADRFMFHPEAQTVWLIDRKAGEIVVMKPEADTHCSIIDMEDASRFGVGVSEDRIAVFKEDEDQHTSIALLENPAALPSEYSSPENDGAGLIAEWNAENYVDGSFCCQGKLFVYGESADDRLTLTARSARTGEVVWRRDISPAAGYRWDDFQMTADGTLLLCETDDGFSLLDLGTGDLRLSWSKNDIERNLENNESGNQGYLYLEETSITPDGKWVLALYGYAGDSDSLSVCALDTEQGTWIPMPQDIKGIPVSLPDATDPSRSLFTSGSGTLTALYSESERSVFLINMNERRIHAVIPFEASEGRCMYLTPNNRFLAAWGDKGTIQIWDVNTGTMVSETEETFTNVTEIYYDSDEEILTVVRSGANRSAYYLTSDGTLVLIRKSMAGNFSHGLFTAIDREKKQLRIYPIRSFEEMISEARRTLG